MKYCFFLFSFLMCLQTVLGQSNKSESLDSLYREDQLYVSVTYNALINMTEGMTQNSFSPGFHLGLIRDFPVNKARNFAIGLGLGYSYNRFNQNLKIDTSSQPIYEIVQGGNFNKSNFSQHLIELPLEFRWRTSNSETYKFWRIYSGIKAGYVFASKSVFEDASERLYSKNLEGLNAWQYGLTLSVGYNTWNGYVYYGLNSVFDSVSTTNNQSIDFNSLKIGLIFYIL